MDRLENKAFGTIKKRGTWNITLIAIGNLTGTGTLISHTTIVELLVGGTWVYLPLF